MTRVENRTWDLTVSRRELLLSIRFSINFFKGSLVYNLVIGTDNTNITRKRIDLPWNEIRCTFTEDLFY